MEIVRWTGIVLCAVASGLIAPVAGAEDSFTGTTALNRHVLPAVDGINFAGSGFGGAVDGRALYGGAGSVSMPLGSRAGLQIDGIVAGFDSRFQGDVAIGGVAAHLFWRDPTRGLIGAYGQYLYADAAGGVDVASGGAEGALYLRRFTLEGVAGVEGGTGDTRFFDVAQLAFYPTDNLRLSAGHSYVFGTNTALFGAEWGFDAGVRTMASLFADGSVSEGGDGTILGGLRIYFGQSEKTLIRRHREDDPYLIVIRQVASTFSVVTSNIAGIIGSR